MHRAIPLICFSNFALVKASEEDNSSDLLWLMLPGILLFYLIITAIFYPMMKNRVSFPIFLLLVIFFPALFWYVFWIFFLQSIFFPPQPEVLQTVRTVPSSRSKMAQATNN